MRFTVDRIDHIVLNVKDVEITAAWYQRVLGMEREDFGPKARTVLKFGGQKLNIRPIDAEPGTWGHFVGVAPPWLAFWSRYQPKHNVNGPNKIKESSIV